MRRMARVRGTLEDSKKFMADNDRRPTSRPPRPFTTLLGEHVGRDHAQFEDGRGKVRLWHLGNRISVFESSGGINGEHAKFIVDYHARFIEKFPRPWYAFGNWMHLLGYTPDTRKILTEWQMKMSYDELHVAHDSRLLAMGIGVANAVLKNTVVVTSSEELLDDVMMGVRKRHGL